MSLVTDRAKREVITSLTLLAFEARSLFATRFRAYRSAKIPTGVHHRARSSRRCELSGAFQRSNVRWRIRGTSYRAKIEDPIMPDVGQGSSKEGLSSTGQGNLEIILSNLPRVIR